MKNLKFGFFTDGKVQDFNLMYCSDSVILEFLERGRFNSDAFKYILKNRSAEVIDALLTSRLYDLESQQSLIRHCSNDQIIYSFQSKLGLRVVKYVLRRSVRLELLEKGDEVVIRAFHEMFTFLLSSTQVQELAARNIVLPNSVFESENEETIMDLTDKIYHLLLHYDSNQGVEKSMVEAEVREYPSLQKLSPSKWVYAYGLEHDYSPQDSEYRLFYTVRDGIKEAHERSLLKSNVQKEILEQIKKGSMSDEAQVYILEKGYKEAITLHSKLHRWCERAANIFIVLGEENDVVDYLGRQEYMCDYLAQIALENGNDAIIKKIIDKGAKGGFEKALIEAGNHEYIMRYVQQRELRYPGQLALVKRRNIAEIKAYVGEGFEFYDGAKELYNNIRCLL